jgi:NAD(P)-dependent dehydrogenase (short-subunit alcohol dehydrogenase family)
MQMKDKVVIVTGAFGVLGRAVVEAAKARGARVAAIDYAQGQADADFSRGGVDLASPEAAAEAIDAAAAALGRVDALINVAGGFTWEPVGDGDPATWERLWAMNVRTTLNATRAALPYLTESGGRIVNVGAAGAVKAGHGMAAYAASKSGVHRLTESLADELKGKVAVNAVLPSILDTPTNRADMPDADPSTWVAPADLAAVILFLASDEARAVTGALVPVTGGV